MVGGMSRSQRQFRQAQATDAASAASSPARGGAGRATGPSSVGSQREPSAASTSRAATVADAGPTVTGWLERTSRLRPCAILTPPFPSLPPPPLVACGNRCRHAPTRNASALRDATLSSRAASSAGRACCHSHSWNMNPALGLAIGRRRRSARNASSNRRLSGDGDAATAGPRPSAAEERAAASASVGSRPTAPRQRAWASTRAAERETPFSQCTSTPPPALSARTMNASATGSVGASSSSAASLRRSVSTRSGATAPALATMPPAVLSTCVTPSDRSDSPSAAAVASPRNTPGATGVHTPTSDRRSPSRRSIARVENSAGAPRGGGGGGGGGGG
mmetsp:Transcript_12703/g.40595  ORF Transcript_12703/g.40595 Transcript_12703/m.40595 type:complete len:335 (-) Transcript_12703:2085-3089(-)